MLIKNVKGTDSAYFHGTLHTKWFRSVYTRQTHKGFKGTVVNRVLPSLHGGSLEIMLTVP